MAFKLSFKFQRNNYQGTPESMHTQICNNIKAKLNEHSIQIIRHYNPSRDSIKIIFPNETEINKVMRSARHFKEAGFEPRLSNRRVQCIVTDLTHHY